MKIVLINGIGRSGKDTFVEFCQKDTSVSGQIWNISTVDLVKKAAKILGWNGEKDEKGRKFLSDLKDLATSYSDLSFTYIHNTIFSAEGIGNVKIIFVHCREPEEIDRLKKELGATTLLIKNNRIKPIISNHADRDVENYNYDYVIENNGTLEELAAQAHKFLDNLDKTH